MLWFSLTTAYAVIAAISIYMTWCEHTQNKRKSPFLASLGIVTCLFWPVAIVAVIYAANRRPA